MTNLIALQDNPSRRSFDHIVEALTFLYTESRRRTKDEARKHDLTSAQLAVMKLLANTGELSLTALSESMQVRNSTVTGIIDRMESAGLVKRVRSETDRRMVLVRLTSQGRKLVRSISIEPMAAFRRALQTLTPHERKTLLRILCKLERHVRIDLARNHGNKNKNNRGSL